MNSSLRPRYLLFFKGYLDSKIKENAPEFYWRHTCSHWNNLQADGFETFQKQQQQNTRLRLRPSMRNYSLGVFILRENYKQRRVDHQQEETSSTFSQEGWLAGRSETRALEATSHALITQAPAALSEKPAWSKMRNTPCGCPMTNNQDELHSSPCDLAESTEFILKNTLPVARMRSDKAFFFPIGWEGATYMKKRSISDHKLHFFCMFPILWSKIPNCL